MASSYHRLTGALISDTVSVDSPAIAIARALHTSPAGLLCHDGGPDPHFTYANATAQRLWKMSWDRLVGMPSRLSAEADRRDERAQMLAKAASDGVYRGYRGTRIASDGSRFEILDATIWTVTDDQGHTVGQAALIPMWLPLVSTRAEPA